MDCQVKYLQDTRIQFYLYVCNVYGCVNASTMFTRMKKVYLKNKANRSSSLDENNVSVMLQKPLDPFKSLSICKFGKSNWNILHVHINCVHLYCHCVW